MDARATLRQAAESGDPLTRCHAIEALSEVIGAKGGSLYFEALSDASPAVRFAAAMAIAKTRYAPAKPKLLRMAKDPEEEPDKRVLCAVLYALHRLGDDTYTGALGQLLFDRDDADARANAAMVMGRMQDLTAREPLKTLLADEQDESVRLQARAALARLGDTESKVRLRAYVKGFFLDLRLAAIPELVAVNPPGAKDDLRALVRQAKAPRLRVVAAGGLAQLGEVSEAGYALARRAMKRPRDVLSEVYGGQEISDVQSRSLRVLAAMALGHMGRLDALGLLHERLDAPAGAIRVAAAMAILRLADPDPTVADAHEPDDGAGDKPDGEASAEDASDELRSPRTPRRRRPRIHTAGAKD
ncbi:MAG: HEAT repeat domain-containing protein [Phycisphaerae bacterium]|nr:HEAT repeat domain-containing protein [Phycisphaerae bacterium]